MTARRTALVAVVLVAGCGLLPAACTRARLVVLDGLDAGVLAAFDRAGATPEPGLWISNPTDGAVIPRNLRFPLVEWRAAAGSADAFLLALEAGGDTLEVVLRGTTWCAADGEFDRFLGHRSVTAVVYQLAGAKTLRSPPVRLAVSERPLTDRIVFRVVHPLFDPTLPNALAAFDPDRRALATVLELDGTCAGCHAYAAGAAFLNLKRGGERLLVTAGGVPGGAPARRLDLGPFSFLAVSPGGGRAVYVNAPVGDLILRDAPVEPFDYPYRAGDLFVLDTGTGARTPLPGAADPDVVEDMPSFSPDGRRVVFSRYRFDGREGAGRVPSMALYEVPFNGGRGGAATPVAGASGDATWNYFARYSPDGRWISFCRGDASRGVYARRSSDIWLLPAAGGRARRLRCNAAGAMDSWHSWSSDARWLAFSSSRERGGMTALYLAHVDAGGDAYPPVKVAGFERMKVNTPQFVPAGFPADALRGLAASAEAAFAPR